MSNDVVTDPEYVQLTNDVLNELKDAIQFIAEAHIIKFEDVVPTYSKWMKKETHLVKADLDRAERDRIKIREVTKLKDEAMIKLHFLKGYLSCPSMELTTESRIKVSEELNEFVESVEQKEKLMRGPNE